MDRCFACIGLTIFVSIFYILYISIIDYIIIIDKIDGMMKGYDNAVRRYIHKLFVREDIPFDALYLFVFGLFTVSINLSLI